MVFEGEILKNYIKSINTSQEQFALDLGYKHRQALIYHFNSEILDNELIKKLKEINHYEPFKKLLMTEQNRNKGAPPEGDTLLLQRINFLERENSLLRELLDNYKANTQMAVAKPELKNKITTATKEKTKLNTVKK